MERRRQVRPQLAQARRRAGGGLGQLGDVLGLERPAGGEQPVEEHTQRVLIRGDAGRAASEQLGRARERSPRAGRARPAFPSGAGIREDDAAGPLRRGPALDHHVRGLHVAVDEPLRVYGSQGVA